MSIQGKFNSDAIKMIPRVREHIIKADNFESNQMECLAIKEMLNLYTPLSEMNDSEISNFENELISTFKFYNWIK